MAAHSCTHSLMRFLPLALPKTAAVSAARPMSIMARAKMRAGLSPSAERDTAPAKSSPLRPTLLPSSSPATLSPHAKPSPSLHHPLRGGLSPTSLADLLPKPISRPDVLASLPTVHAHPEQPVNPQTLHAAVLGPANAGKSSIVNALISRHVSIVSPRAQTTRERINAVWTHDNVQVVFSDTPGVVDTKHRSRVSRGVINASWSTLPTSQHVLVVLDAGKLLYKAGEASIEAFMFRRLAEYRLPLTFVFNKLDQVVVDPLAYPDSVTPPCIFHSSAAIRPSPRLALTHPQLDPEKQTLGMAAQYLVDKFVSSARTPAHDCPAVFFLSSAQGWGLAELKSHLIQQCQPGEHMFPPSIATDTAPQSLLTQFVRQGFYERLHGYLPYTLRQNTVVWEQLPSGGMHIVQHIMVDRPGQQKIVVGKGGSIVHAVEEQAAKALSEAIGSPVSLRVQVMVAKG